MRHNSEHLAGLAGRTAVEEELDTDYRAAVREVDDAYTWKVRPRRMNHDLGQPLLSVAVVLGDLDAKAGLIRNPKLQ